jgi:hypothetical protein
MMKRAPALILLFMSTMCLAADWEELVGTSPVSFINQKSIKKIDVFGKTYTQAWIKTKLDKPKILEGKTVTEASSLYIVDCENNTLALKSISLRHHGSLVQSISNQDYELKFSPIEPETNAEAFAEAICSPS